MNNDLDQKTFWDIKDIAEYTGFCVSTIRNNFIKRANFPLPIRSNSVMKRGVKRYWFAEDVKEALRNFREEEKQ